MIRHLKVFLAFLLLSSLTACFSSSSSEALKALPQDLVQDGYVASVTIKDLPEDAPDDLSDALQTALTQRLAQCAQGHRPLRLEARVTRFTADDAAKKLFLGGSNDIRGSVQFFDARTNTLIGAYDIDRSRGGGGIIATIAMSDATEDRAAAFADDVCKLAFKHSR